MSASTQAAPAQVRFGRFPVALALVGLAIVIAAAVAVVAMYGTKTASPAIGTASVVQAGQSVTNVPFYDHGWSKINEPGQSVTNVPFYDHGWSIAGTSKPAVVGYPIFGSQYFPAKVDSVGTGYPPFGATYGGSRIDTVDHGARDAAAAAAAQSRIDAVDKGARDEKASEPEYVAPRPRNQ
jgi:hypothetical protein